LDSATKQILVGGIRRYAKPVFQYLATFGVGLFAGVSGLISTEALKTVEGYLRNGAIVVQWQDEVPQGTIVALESQGTTKYINLNSKTDIAPGDYTVRVTRMRSGVKDALPVSVMLVNADTGKELASNLVTIGRWDKIRLRATPRFNNMLSFAQAAKVFDRLLGEPLSGPVRVDHAFDSFVGNARILWTLTPTRTFFVVDPIAQEWISLPDLDSSREECLYDQKCVDEREHAPDGFHVPIGGMLQVWKDYRAKYGSRWPWESGHCGYFNTIYSQEFERGLLVGPVRTSKTDGLAQIIAFLHEDGKRTYRVFGPDNLPAPKCE
jgi:hypothetical protein